MYCQFRSSLVTLAVVTLMLVSSGNAADGNPRSKETARIGREFQLKATHEVTLKSEGLRVKFVEVKDDSRCPSDVTCVWAGTANVRIEVSFRGKGRKNLTLNLMNNAAPVSYRNYKISLTGLSPYPRRDRKIEPGDYEATLLVNKN
ncbi:MAG TPA: hypothetical protein VGN90_06640 [Pyrinomonadaceae bacterium]|jgi:hypothetical protein|nr:hypothetical protein [Pyrinomonadaceae bacterium]